MSTNLVVIDSKAKTYAVYEGRKLKVKFKSDHLLYACEVEELREGNWEGEDPDGDLEA